MLLRSTQKQLGEEVQKLVKAHKDNPLTPARAVRGPRYCHAPECALSAPLLVRAPAHLWRARRGRSAPVSVQMHADYSAINMTHHIHQLHFGPPYHGRRNALDNFDRIVDHDYGTFRYFVTIVPVTFVSSLWSKTRSFTYSVSEYFLPGTAHASAGGEDVNIEAMPALEFRMDMSPLEVTITYPARQIGHFLVRLCAVLGGCFALTRFADKVVDGVMGMAGNSR